MPKFIVWYKKEIKANDLNSAIRAERKVPLEFHSIEADEDKSERQLEPLIGFTCYQESDYEDD